jgi:ligand-binding sensor domain-containing protein/signal transduction histidine kinase
MNRASREFLFPSNRWSHTLLALLLAAPASVWAASSSLGSTNGISSYNVRIWQTDDGLPQNSVHAIAQTHDGYLWVGTLEGLTRFDGVRFTALGDTAPAELKHGSITALCTIHDGSLWIGCEGYGVARLQNGKFTRFSEADGLLSNQIRCLMEGRDGSLWIGSDGGLTRYKDGRFHSFSEKNGLASNSVKALCEDCDGNIRIATLRGLSSLNKDGIISTFNVAIGTAANALKSVVQDRHGRIWTVSNEGLYRLEGESITTYGVPDGLPDRIVTVAFEDRGGQLWIGTYRGLVRVLDGKIVPRPNAEGVFGDWIYTVFQDHEGNLWVGSQDGLYRLNPARFTTYTTHEGLTHNNIMSVLQDRAGTLWVGTWGGGLNQLKDGRIEAYTTRSGLSHDSVLALYESPEGSLWVGTDHGGGLNRFKDGPRNLFDPPQRDGLIDAAIRVITQDREGTLWIGTSRGLNIFEDPQFHTFTTAAGLAGNIILTLRQTADGSMWVGTDSGLSCWREGRFTNFTTREGLPVNYITALYEDAARTLWIGTRGGGLVRYSAAKFTAYTTRQGLFSDEIYEIVEDDFGCLWMSCRKGIFRVNRKELDAFDRGVIKGISSTGFGRADGLVTVQCNGVAKPSGWKGNDGRLWFATIHGIVAVEPRIKTNDDPPPVVIEDVLADHRPLVLAQGDDAATRALHIPPGRGGLEIHYAALSFQAPEKNRYKYRLEEIDPGWVDAGSSRSAYYNNIPYGKYRFRVIACNNDGVWNQTGATLSLVLLPHYWQTLWFKLALTAAIALSLTLLYRLRVRRLRDIERLRVQIAANLHDDVGARLTKVAMVTEVVDRETGNTQATKPHIQNILKTVREITQAMDEIVWTINPKNDTLDNLANYVFQYAQEYFQDTPVSCRLDVPAQLPDRAVSTGTRHNLFMAVKEALNNALKHAAATEVRIGMGVTDSRMTITIADNGRGFILGQAAGKGDGLQNMKERLTQIGGHLVVQSQPGGGTTITMDAVSR